MSKAYIFADDGHRDSAELQKIAQDEEGLKTILILYWKEMLRVVIPESINITHNPNRITYHYTDGYGDDTVYTDGEATFFTADLLPALPATMLMLEILHECPDAQEAGYEYTEAWPYQDTPEGLAAANAAIQEDIGRCKEDPDAPPFVNARIWRCTANQHGAYTDAEEVVTVNLYKTDDI